MSALDDLIKIAYSDGKYFVREAAKLAEPELSALRTDNAALLARVSELEQAAQPVTLTPRQCVEGRACYLRGWESAREAAAVYADDFDADDLGFDVPTSIGAGIRALTPTDDCGDCNPLKPEDTWESLGMGIVEVEPDHSEGA